jgi:glycosyltransferase involved in cell wall biosynthesis
MNKPLVSVLLCANRVDQYLESAINSILNQTLDNFELILIANGVSDQQFNLLESITKDSRIRKYRTSITGLTFSLNLGIHFSASPFIARMDADDIARPDRLIRQYELMSAQESICACGSWIELIDSNNSPLKLIKYPKSDSKIRAMLYFSNPFCHPSVMIRKSVLQKCGGYMGGQYAEDFDLWIRLAREKSNSFANIPEVLLGYRASSGGHARGAAQAHASVSGSQWAQFALSGNIAWFMAAILSFFKRIFLARH